MNKEIKKFVNDANLLLLSFYENNPDAPKLQPLKWEDSQVQERMMRLGIEARILKPDNNDELMDIAVATLKNDFVKYSMIEKQEVKANHD